MFEVKLEYSRKLLKTHGPELVAQITAVATALPRALALAIRTRVQGRGDLAGQVFPGWSTRTASRKELTHDVSAKYPDRATGELGPGGAEWYSDAAAYHAANSTRRGTYSTTGGMWAGLSVVVWSPTASDILFRGRSAGADPRYVKGKSKPLKINNALKASTVLLAHNINVLALSQTELDGLNAGVRAGVQQALGTSMGVRWQDRSLSVGLPLDAIFREALGVVGDLGAF